MGKAPATVVVVTHNNERHIAAVLDRLLADPAGPEDIIVVDNGSVDATLDILGTYEVGVISLPENRGFPAGCNIGAAKAGSEFVAFLNPDTEPHPGWIPPLLAALAEPGVGAAMPVIELTYAPGHFFTSASALTYLGFAWSTDSGLPIPSGLRTGEVPFPSGAAFAIRRTLFEQLGGFRASYFLYLEDVDLGWRLRLRGFRSVQVPAARVAHDYEFNRHTAKMFYLERNRLRMVFSNYEARTLALLAPALLAAELGVAAAAAKNGWLRHKLASWVDLWRLRRTIVVEREATVRSVADSAILPAMGAALEGITQMPLPPYMGFINRLLAVYQRLIVRWL